MLIPVHAHEPVRTTECCSALMQQDSMLSRFLLLEATMVGSVSGVGKGGKCGIVGKC